jgi:two-component system sensor histidine kinase HydH
MSSGDETASFRPSAAQAAGEPALSPKRRRAPRKAKQPKQSSGTAAKPGTGAIAAAGATPGTSSYRRLARSGLGDPQAMSSDQLIAELERLRPLAELGRLAATVAHEVRNPLAGISANAELLRESLHDPDDLQSLDIILGEVDRLGTLVSDLLLFSRERPAERSLIDLAVVARAAVELSASDAERQGVTLAAEGHGLAWGDAELSRQALLNLVRNALQATPAGGSVRLQCADGRIAVVDSGPGVPEALRERLFEPFVTGRTRGLGLGCAVARRCLRRQGGEAILENSGPMGSVFALTWAHGS